MDGRPDVLTPAGLAGSHYAQMTGEVKAEP